MNLQVTSNYKTPAVILLESFPTASLLRKSQKPNDVLAVVGRG